MGIPDLKFGREVGKQHAGAVLHRERALAIFTLLAWLHFSPEILGKQLDTITDA
jgi:hypothetical protein